MTLPQTPAVTEKYIASACVSASQITCLRSTETLFYNNASLIGECYNNCPIECTELKYELTISTSLYPTEWYAKVLTSSPRFNSIINAYFSMVNVPFINYTDDYLGLKNSIARINVFYEDLRYTQVDDSPAMSVITLLGTLGGNFGLFLGELSFH